MIVVDNSDYRRDPQLMSAEDALLVVASGYTDRGQLEDLAADISALRELVCRALAANVATVEQLNKLAGYDRFREVRAKK